MSSNIIALKRTRKIAGSNTYISVYAACAGVSDIRGWSRYDLIAIDEVGYVPLAEVGAEYLFQVIAERTADHGSCAHSGDRNRVLSLSADACIRSNEPPVIPRSYSVRGRDVPPCVPRAMSALAHCREARAVLPVPLSLLLRYSISLSWNECQSSSFF